MSTPGAEADFRHWLVQKLTLTRWPTRANESLEQLAERLWVHPEALRRAQALLDERQRGSGRKRKKLDTKDKALRPRLDLSVPVEIHRVVHDYCRIRNLAVGVWMRSLIHQMLLEPQNPSMPDAWVWNGQRYKMLKSGRKIDGMETLKTDLTAGAVRALTARALDAGRPVAALVRGLLLEALYNKRVRYEILTRPSQMWDDENRYIQRLPR